MKLRHLAYLGTLLTPVLFGCSDDATVLSVNINLSNDKLDRSNPGAWSAIQVSIAGRPLPTPIPIQTEVVQVEMTDANGMKSMVDVTQIKARWFQRIDMPGGYQDGGAVTASATGAYKQTSKVGDMDVTNVIANYAFSTEKKAGDKDPTINVDPDAAVIEEVSALFLNFNPPEPAPPAGGSGGGGSGGTPAATGGTETGGTATGGATGGSPAATTGGAPAAPTGGAAPMDAGGGGAGGAASDNGGTTSSNGGGGSGGGETAMAGGAGKM